eukprot:769515-Amorphochlora_amoeboformis.AAC.1
MTMCSLHQAASNLEKRDIVTESEQRRFRRVLVKLERHVHELKREDEILGEVLVGYEIKILSGPI